MFAKAQSITNTPQTLPYSKVVLVLVAAIISHLLSLVKGTMYPAQSSFKPPI
jgi:hypothetical protein